MRLNELADNEGARKPARRVGRGIGSGTGKTAGRGHKGQKARTGVAIKGFEGGQMPLYRRLPKRGFHNPNAKSFQELTVTKLATAIEAGRVDAKQKLTEAVLLEAGVVRRILDGVRLIGGGEFKAKVDIEVTGATKGAIALVEKAGGTVTVRPKAKAAEAGKAEPKKAKAEPKKAKAADADSSDADSSGADTSDT